MISQLEQIRPVSFDSALNGYSNLIAQREKEKQYWMALAHEQHPMFRNAAKQKLAEMGVDLSVPQTAGSNLVGKIYAGEYDKSPTVIETPMAKLNDNFDDSGIVNQIAAERGIKKGSGKEWIDTVLANDQNYDAQTRYNELLSAQVNKQRDALQTDALMNQSAEAIKSNPGISAKQAVDGVEAKSLAAGNRGLFGETVKKTVLPQAERPDVSAQDILTWVAGQSGDSSMPGISGRAVEAIRKMYGNTDKANQLITDLVGIGTGNSQDIGMPGIDKRFAGALIGGTKPTPGPNSGRSSQYGIVLDGKTVTISDGAGKGGQELMTEANAEAALNSVYGPIYSPDNPNEFAKNLKAGAYKDLDKGSLYQKAYAALGKGSPKTSAYQSDPGMDTIGGAQPLAVYNDEWGSDSVIIDGKKISLDKNIGEKGFRELYNKATTEARLRGLNSVAATELLMDYFGGKTSAAFAAIRPALDKKYNPQAGAKKGAVD